MKTLFVKCSDDELINSLCNESALKTGEAKSLCLCGEKERSSFSRYFGINRVRRYSSVGSYGVDVSSFEKVIIACDEYMGEIPPEVSAFITKSDMRYKAIDCIVFADGRNARKAKDSLKVRVSLSGGTVRNCVSISKAEAKKEAEDILFSVRHRLAV